MKDNVAMSKDDQNEIRRILTELNLYWNEPSDLTGDRFRIPINDYCTRINVFFNIPRNQKFVFQLFFEKNKSDSEYVRLIHEDIRRITPKDYTIGGGGSYATIYLPQKEYSIIKENRELIKNRIMTEILLVSRILRV